MKKNILLFSFFFFLGIWNLGFGTWDFAQAQCAMCRAVAESAQDENSIRTGLNFGILYLLAVPYLLIGGIIFIVFKKQITEKIKALKR